MWDANQPFLRQVTPHRSSPANWAVRQAARTLVYASHRFPVSSSDQYFHTPVPTGSKAARPRSVTQTTRRSEQMRLLQAAIDLKYIRIIATNVLHATLRQAPALSFVNTLRRCGQVHGGCCPQAPPRAAACVGAGSTRGDPPASAQGVAADRARCFYYITLQCKAARSGRAL